MRGFHSALAAAAHLVDAVPSGRVPIAKAGEKAKTSRVDIVHLVLGGYLSNAVRVPGREGHAAVHVDPAAVRARHDEHLPGVSVSVVAAGMRLPIRTAGALLGTRDGEAVPASSPLHRPIGRHSFRRVDPPDVERFQGTYATEVHIATAMGVGRTTIERELRAARVRPVIAAAEVGVDVYGLDRLPAQFSVEVTRTAA